MRFLFLLLLALVTLPTAIAADQRFIYGDTTNWYTYDASGRVSYGYPSVASSYYYVDRDSVVFHSYDEQGSFYSYQPVRNNRWSCVGTGCGKTPYVQPIVHNQYPPSIYDYRTPAVWQPW